MTKLSRERADADLTDSCGLGEVGDDLAPSRLAAIGGQSVGQRW